MKFIHSFVMMAAFIAGMEITGAEGIRPADPGDPDYILDASKDQELLALWKTQNRVMRANELGAICARSNGRLAYYVAEVLATDPDYEMRDEAAYVLRYCGDREIAVTALKKAINDKSEHVQIAAANSLLERKEYAEAANVYLRHLSSGSEVAVRNAAYSLAYFDIDKPIFDKMANELQLIKADDSKSVWRRSLAAMGLISYRFSYFDEETVMLIADYIKEKDANVDMESKKNVNRYLDWIEAMERNRRPSATVRKKMIRAIQPAVDSKSIEIREKANDVIRKLQLKQ